MELIAQILGIVAIAVSVTSMLMKKKSNIMLLCTIYNILTLISYLLLHKYLGSILVGVLTLKSLTYYIFSLKNLKPNVIVLIIFEVAILGLSIFLWQSWTDIFILISSLINTYSSWQDNVKFIKICVIICTVFLVAYDIFAHAYVYVVSEVLYGGAALFSLLHTKKNKDETKNETNDEILIEDQKENQDEQTNN